MTAEDRIPASGRLKPIWARRLRPFEQAYMAFIQTVYDGLTGMDDAALEQIIRDCSEPSQTNCSWAMYAAARIVREEAVIEQQVRLRIAAAVVNPTCQPPANDTAPATAGAGEEPFYDKEKTMVEHAKADISPDDEGTWWWACTCDSGEGGYATEVAATSGLAAHLQRETGVNPLAVGCPGDD